MMNKQIKMWLLSAFMMFFAASCSNMEMQTTVPTSSIETTTIVTTTANESNNLMLHDLDEENARILAEFKEQGCLYEFNKKLYPAEHLFEMEKLELPVMIKGQYWILFDLYDPETYIVELVERDLKGSGKGYVQTEYGIYNFVTNEYSTIYEFDNSTEYHVRGIDIINNSTGEFLITDSSTDNLYRGKVRYEYVNLSVGERRVLQELDTSEYYFMFVPKVVDGVLYFNKLGLNENKLMSVNIDTGEVNEVDEYAIMPQLYRGSLIYAKDLITTPKIELVGTDFPLSWEQSDSRPTLSNVHGSIISHKDSDTLFVLTITRDTDRMIENISELGEDSTTKDYPLYTLKKYSPTNPEGEEILSIRGKKTVSVYMGELGFDGRFLKWFSAEENKHMLYDNELDVLLYFSNVNVNEKTMAAIFLSPSGHVGTILDSIPPITGERDWDSSLKVQRTHTRFILK